MDENVSNGWIGQETKGLLYKIAISDINNDNALDVVDVVALVNIIIDEND